MKKIIADVDYLKGTVLYGHYELNLHESEYEGFKKLSKDDQKGVIYRDGTLIVDKTDFTNFGEITSITTEEVESMPDFEQFKFKVGDRAYKPKGYAFPCTIVSVFKTKNGDIRVVGEMDGNGLLHIFNENQLKTVESINYLTIGGFELDMREVGDYDFSGCEEAILSIANRYIHDLVSDETRNKIISEILELDCIKNQEKG